MGADFKDYYATLGVARDANADEIKKAFRKLARQHHPDVAKDKSASDAVFKSINEAHEVLSDPVKRKKYDQLGIDWEKREAGSQSARHSQHADEQEFHFGGTGFSDFFEQYFSGGSGYGFPGEASGGFGPRSRSHTRPTGGWRGSDIEGDLLVTLNEALHGTLRPISLQILNRQTGQAEMRTFKVRIPPGATDGRRIRVPGHGEPGHGGGPPGDLFLRVRHAAHPDFTSRGADIFHELDIAPWEAVLGAEIQVPTLDGSIRLRIPPHCENGQKLRVRARGLPKGKGGGRGEFFVILQVQLPKKISSEERALWEQLRDRSSFLQRPNKTENPITP